MIADADPENRRQAAPPGRLECGIRPVARKALSDAEPSAPAPPRPWPPGGRGFGAGPVEVVADESRDVRQQALEALKDITKQDLDGDAGKWDDWWRSQNP